MNEKECMDVVMKLFDSRGLELWEFIEALQTIEDIYLEQAENYPDATPPRIRIGTKEGTNEPLVVIRQRLHSFRSFDNDLGLTGFLTPEGKQLTFKGEKK
jgi:hypothetical protein